MPTLTAISCPQCRASIQETDRYCRHCGASVTGGDDLYRTMVESLSVGLFIVDAGSRIRYWNRAMEEQTGIQRREALGRVVFGVLPHLQAHSHQVMRVLETALPIRLDQVGRPGEQGSERLERIRLRSILLSDETPAILAMVEDTTSRVRLDTELIRSERLAAIGELAAGVAHNFNNILAAIGGDAQLLQMTAEEDNLPAEVRECARKIYEETMRAGRVAHDLLSFARGAEPQICPMDVHALMQDVLRLIRNHPAAKLASIEPNVPERLPRVSADPNQLHQVFFNLTLNALQAMPEGGILTISAGVRGHEEDPTVGMLDVKFHDTGVGISRDRQRRVFDPFYSSRPGGATGSGLGLAVSLAMIKGLGGDIHLTSAEGIGTTVTVSLPILERRISPRGGKQPETRGRVLVVDDDPSICRTLTALLTRYGFEVILASGIEDGLLRLKESGPFAVAVTELALVDGNGLSFVEEAGTLQAEIPIIVLTSAGDPQHLREAIDSGAQYAFSKPPNFTELLSVIERVAKPPARTLDEEPDGPEAN